jgi:glycosyltransferase involved in cell wall biosynthesis
LCKISSKLADQGVSILVVGSSGWGESFKNLNTADGTVMFTGYIEVNELVDLYNSADLYVSTSLNEGFGLPILEAIVCGCPIVTPHNSAMIELGSFFGNTIIGWNEQVWIDTIVKTIQEKKSLVNNKEEKLLKYDWLKIALNLKEYLKH